MTLDDIKTMDKEFLVPAEAAKILGCDPHYIRVAARQCPGALGFPVICLGNRTKIPRRAFVRYMEGRLGPKGES